jgi:CheY-like chemotaxis protein
MDGVEAVRSIRRLPSDYARDVPVVAFTASDAPGKDRMFVENGFDSFIAKPIDIMELDAVLNRWVRRDAPPDARGRGPASRASSRAASGPPAPAAAGAPGRPSGAGAAPAPVPGPAGAAPAGPGTGGASQGPSLRDTAIEGLDVETGIGRYGQEEKYLKVLKSYVLHTPKLLESLKSSARSSLGDYAISVHGLKGSSYGISANAVGDAAARLEAMAKAGETGSFADSHLLLMEKAEKLIQDISSAVNRIEAGRGAKSKGRLPAPDRVALKRLQDAARRGKTSLMEEITSELEGYEYDREADLVPFVREKLEEFEYQLICDRIQRILGD